jgi:hypothetical protein
MSVIEVSEISARIAYLRFEYSRAVDGAEPDMSSEDIEFLNELNEEYIYATGKNIELFTSAEMAAWYDKAGHEVRAVLGDYVQF